MFIKKYDFTQINNQKNTYLMTFIKHNTQKEKHTAKPIQENNHE